MSPIPSSNKFWRDTINSGLSFKTSKTFKVCVMGFSFRWGMNESLFQPDLTKNRSERSSVTTPVLRAITNLIANDDDSTTEV